MQTGVQMTRPFFHTASPYVSYDDNSSTGTALRAASDTRSVSLSVVLSPSLIRFFLSLPPSRTGCTPEPTGRVGQGYTWRFVSLSLSLCDRQLVVHFVCIPNGFGNLDIQLRSPIGANVFLAALRATRA